MILGFMGCFLGHVSYQTQLCKIVFRLLYRMCLLIVFPRASSLLAKRSLLCRGVRLQFGHASARVRTAILERKLKIGKERQWIHLVLELKMRIQVSANFQVNLLVLYDM